MSAALILHAALAMVDAAPANQAQWFNEYCASANIRPTLTRFTITRSLVRHILRTP
tara:strand:+ start:101 stop:268 length:168 start_codon:yes stop_codon:yes gene_type:complete